MHNKAEEAKVVPKSHSVVFTADEDQELNAELHVSSFSIDLDDDVDWEERSSEAAAPAAIDEASEKHLF